MLIQLYNDIKVEIMIFSFPYVTSMLVLTVLK